MAGIGKVQSSLLGCLSYFQKNLINAQA